MRYIGSRGSNGVFVAIRNVYDHQDHVTKVLAHDHPQGDGWRLAETHSTERALLLKKGCQAQYLQLVKLADSVVLEELLQFLEDNSHRATSTKDLLEFGCGPTQYYQSLDEVCWHPI